MKKIVSLAAIVLGLNFIACKEKSKDSGSKANQHTAVIVFVSGQDAKVVSTRGQQNAAKGMTLIETDKLLTGAKSQVDILLPNKILLRIDRNSTIEIREFGIGENGAQSDKIYLAKGSAFAKVKKLQPNSAFAIQTPTVVAGVRGTQFLTEADEKGGGKVAVSEGKVAVNSQSGATQDVTEGNQATVAQGGALSAGKFDAATQAKLNDLSQVTKYSDSDLSWFENILQDQQAAIDKAGGTQKIQEMIEQNNQKIEDQKKQTEQKIGDIKGQTDSKIQDMKKTTEDKMNAPTEAVEEQKRKREELFNKMKPGGGLPK